MNTYREGTLASTSVIVTCAIKGSPHTPFMSPHFPFTPDEIVAESLMGGNVCVGLEDSLRIGPAQRAKPNAKQVAKIRSVLETLNLTIATPEEAWTRLQLKGGDAVNF